MPPLLKRTLFNTLIFLSTIYILSTALSTVYSVLAFLSAYIYIIIYIFTTLPISFNRSINIFFLNILDLIVIVIFIILINSNNIIYNIKEIISFLFILNIY